MSRGNQGGKAEQQQIGLGMAGGWTWTERDVYELCASGFDRGGGGGVSREALQVGWNV